MTIILFYLCIRYLLSAHYKLDTVRCRWSVNKTEWYPCSAVVGLWVSSSNRLEVGNKCQQQKQNGRCRLGVLRKGKQMKNSDPGV